MCVCVYKCGSSKIHLTQVQSPTASADSLSHEC